MNVQTIELVLSSAITAGTPKPIVNVFHYQAPIAGAYQGQEQNIMNGFLAAPYNTLTAALNAAWTYGLLTARWLEDSTLPAVPWAGAAPRNGQVAGDFLPTNVAAYFLLRTPMRGRNYRGAKHFAPITEADTTGNELTGAGLTRWQALQSGAGSLADIINDGTRNYQPCVLSRKLSTLVNPTNIVVAQFGTGVGGAVLLDKTLGTMRRRRERTVR